MFWYKIWKKAKKHIFIDYDNNCHILLDLWSNFLSLKIVSKHTVTTSQLSTVQNSRKVYMNTNIVLCGDLKKTKKKPQQTKQKNSWSLACYKTNQKNRQNGAAKKQLKLFWKERGEGDVYTL